ncbi:unnamed protein product [Cyprideis torosa]|uniref:Uncharacterized protein n=1 Tax=Cyprideis torosa TaxID=163714 RepID=A0A7R8ZGP6_9CRUS|nr:unnamed protein product [Cyprideis torosa]CAG0880690.1 unnamed protein product [Cyprideis torosa]
MPLMHKKKKALYRHLMCLTPFRHMRAHRAQTALLFPPPHIFKHRWTSFLKARLNCSLPGEFPFYFNEIQSTSDIVRGIYGDIEEEVVYGVFTTPQNSLPGSAICAFRMKDLLETFVGPFKEQKTPQSQWLRVRQSDVPEPHPGQCVNDSRTLSDASLNFLKQHPLMDGAVPHFFQRPILVKASFKYRFTQIAVDPAVPGADEKRVYDVLFIGTDDGHILKVVNVRAFDIQEELIVEELQVLPIGQPVTNLMLTEGERPADTFYGDYVFFFFREMAVEYTNCGKAVYSRVARVCRNDKGGPHIFKHRWTSFLKARLNCSLPGEFPFYFNEIQSTSDIVRGIYGDIEEEVVYGVFTTPQNSLPGSAICAFRMKDLLETFVGPFKEQKTPQSQWLRVRQSDVPEPHPGQCVNDSRTLSDASLNFLKQHPLMDGAVPHFFQRPILVKASFKYRFTQIAVDPAVPGADEKRVYDVLFIGTDDGHILKVVNVRAFDIQEELIVEELQVLPIGQPVTNLMLTEGERPADTKRLVIVSDDKILSIPVERCARYALTCEDCVALRDPYCSWNIQKQACGYQQKPRRLNIQDIFSGSLSGCNALNLGGDQPRIRDDERPKSTTPIGSGAGVYSGSSFGRTVYSETEEDRYNTILPASSASFPATVESVRTYTAETFAIAVTTSSVFALMVGFVAGYWFSRRCRPEDYASAYTGIRFPGDYTSDGSFLNAGSPPMNNKSINLVINVPSKANNGKTANSAVDTKPMPTVKKIYL